MKALYDFRLLPALFLPDGTDARQTAARALTDINQVEHLSLIGQGQVQQGR